MGFFDNPVKDADKIHNEINYKVLRAAWDSYVRIKRKDFGKVHSTATPAWFALFAVKNYGGKFRRFNVEEINLLKSFTSVHDAYEEITKSLSIHSDDAHLAENIIETHPDLFEHVPAEYRSEEKINEYLIQVIRQYQQMLEEFYSKYKDKIDNAISNLEQKIQSGETTSNADENEFSEE